MNRELVLTVSGTLAPNKGISVRTISHTLPHLQRAIDKVVLFEKYGEIRKRSALPSNLYGCADLYLDKFESGSIKIPLFGDLLAGVGGRINQFLKEPYEQAASEFVQELSPLLTQLDYALISVSNGNAKKITQKELIENGDAMERYHAQAAFLKDINTMLSPLRAKSSTGDTIKLTNNVSGSTADYTFNHENSKTFGKIVRQSRLAKPAIYTGKLIGLKASKSKTFPIHGTFISEITRREMTLLVAKENDALELNKYNLTKKTMTFWACPLAVYESFDQLCGDIAFVSLIKDSNS